jgi:hypothetical protein
MSRAQIELSIADKVYTAEKANAAALGHGLADIVVLSIGAFCGVLSLAGESERPAAWPQPRIVTGRGGGLMPFVDIPGGEQEYRPMPGPQLLESRLALGMTRLEFAYLLGMTGEKRNIYSTIKRYEEGRRDISPMVERLVLMLLWHKSDFGYLPDLDRGERVPVDTALSSAE